MEVMLLALGGIVFGVLLILYAIFDYTAEKRGDFDGPDSNS
jgi:cbb3-type cytochrome oxidase subunit 3